MSYNKKGYYIRAANIRTVAQQHYELGRQDRCYKWVWKYHIWPLFGIGYRSFLNYLKVEEPPQSNQEPTLF